MKGSHYAAEQRLEIFRSEQQHLLSIAFRILGSQADAEDAVQEAWIKFDVAQKDTVRNLPAWSTTIVTRLCLDMLRLRQRHETPQETPELVEYTGEGPEEVALLGDELTAAFALVLDELTPPQRVALVLHDSFGMPFEDIAHILGTTVTSAKKLASRARGRVRRQVSGSTANSTEAQRIVEAFLRAAQHGDTARLVSLLAPHVVRLADAHVLPPHGNQRIEGADAVVAQTLAFRANAARARLAIIDGRPGIVVLAGSVIQAALVVRVQQSHITHYDVVADPQRLAALHIDTNISGA